MWPAPPSERPSTDRLALETGDVRILEWDLIRPAPAVALDDRGNSLGSRRGNADVSMISRENGRS